MNALGAPAGGATRIARRRGRARAHGVAALAFVAIGAAASGCGSCSKDHGGSSDADAFGDAAGLVSAPSTTAPGAPRPGMVFIPSGILKAGTPIDQIPRIADEELAGVEIPLGGFYIDVLPFPNEAGAIPTTNKSRDDAQRLCAEKGKRLCTELEWERACKGPSNARYEYGDTYRAADCATGQSIERAGMRPAGQRMTCQSAFGVKEMHGGAWEWTDSSWGRGRTADLGVLRGGNSEAGEIVGRCANALARPPSTQSPTMGFRCCAGPRNEAKVELAVKFGSPLSKIENPADLPAAIQALECPATSSSSSGDGSSEGTPCAFPRQWIWRPTGNVEIFLRNGCIGSGLGLRCTIAAHTMLGDKIVPLARFAIGREIPEVVLVAGEQRNVRARGGDIKGPVFRELVYSYGKVDVKGHDPIF
jgi:sulfatase modifying factor 1